MADYVTYPDPEELAHQLYYWDGQQLTGQRLLESEGDYLPLDMEEPMSLSRPTMTNPAEHFFEWKGKQGKIQFYDKERKENITVPLPFEFIVLDELSTITGYDSEAKSGIWSNEVRSTVKESFTVRDKSGIRKQGVYQEVKDQNHHFTRSVYIAHKNRAGELILGNIKFSGAALGPWIEFTRANVVGNGKVKITGGIEDKNGAVTFQRPVFEYTNMSTEEYQAAVELDKYLQKYLDQYLAAPKDEDTAPVEEIDPELGYVTDPAEIERLSNATPKKVERYDAEDRVHAENPMGPTISEQERIKQANAKAMEDFGGEPINLDDIPF